MIELYKEDPLYLAIMHNDIPKIKSLKNKGFTLSEFAVKLLTCPVGGAAKMSEFTLPWYGHIEAVRKLSGQKLIDVLHRLTEELGQQMYCSSAYNWEYSKRFYEPELFACVLDCFDNRKIQKKKVWTFIIENDNVALMAIAAEHGWLKMTKKRDELIEQASRQSKAECLAWLLDFKKKTADVAKEQERAEKKLMRELNADPNSVSEIKKRFGFNKKEDSTLTVTSCKRGLGSSLEVTVPEKVGKDTVTEIGSYAFSTFAGRLTKECNEFRHSIEKVRLPDTIKAIRSNAFSHCVSIKEINIPDGVEIIEERAFSMCRSVKMLTVPDSVKSVGESAFAYCKALERIKLPCDLEQILGGSFADCTMLERIRLPEKLKEIGRYAFNRCLALKEIDIPKGVEVLRTYSFNYCYALEKAVFHEGLKKLEKNVFECCKSLKEVVLPEGLDEIGSLTFAGCLALEKIYLPKSLRKMQNYTVNTVTPQSVFDNCPKLTAMVYKGSYSEKYCKRNNIPYEIREEI